MNEILILKIVEVVNAYEMRRYILGIVKQQYFKYRSHVLSYRNYNYVLIAKICNIAHFVLTMTNKTNSIEEVKKMM